MSETSSGLATNSSRELLTSDLFVDSIPLASDVVLAMRSGVSIGVLNETTQADILERIANATSIEEMESDGGMTKVSEVLGTPFQFLSILSANPSTKPGKGTIKFYLVVEASDREGEIRTFTVGATEPVMKLLRAREISALPHWGRFEEGVATENGTTVNLRWIDGPENSF